MALEIKLNQKLSQSLVMTPQLQQAIKLLQLGRMEYLEVIEQELLENPVLEDIRESESDLPSNSETLASNIAESPAPAPSPEEAAELPGSLFDYGTSKGARSEGSYERPSIEATVSSKEGLSSHLLWQLRTGDLDEENFEIAAQIIGNIDHNGYLCCSMEEVASAVPCDVVEAESVLSLIQTLDPPGIAGRDLSECLQIQLEQKGLGQTLVAKIVSEHLEHLELRRYDAVAKAENVSLEEVYEAIKEIQKLEPRPGRPFSEEEPIYITPDVYVRKVGNDYLVSLNENGMPRLKLNSTYERLLEKSKNADPKEIDYIQDRVKSASWLIRSIEQRQNTIFRVTESIMKHQRDFLESGVSALKPLVLREIAADVEMHESTISRVTSNKYVHTPQGVFELKFFFSSGLRSGTGEVSSESVKEKIRELVAKENPKKPLSDQAIVNLLTADGIDIARRTVAKYREMMNILSSSRRKKVF